MAKVMLICGKICCGKSTYARQLRLGRRGTAVLSVDEIMLAMFGQHVGEKHDDYVERTKNYLLQKSLELLESGIDVILDWGFWQKAEREAARAFYREHGVPCEFHYIDIGEKEWQSRLKRRNAAVLEDDSIAYYVDENIAAKFAAMFEAPGREEIDVWVAQ